MNDDRLWEFERTLWTGGADAYETQVAEDVVMSLPAAPFLYDRRAAVDAVKNTPRWDEVEFADTRVERHQEGLIVIAYRARAKGGERTYDALCTSTLLRLDHEEWVVIQHQQTPLGVEVADPNG
ncbi:MAG: DUF4440 domain-containing protein [Sphingomonadaceae bacterium]|nr:DUF4440 domain-containing protein [Sphingomonadaceae bacterium]MEC7953998.1 DUF4440 domain-containing protein [Pseudomonadota bacterium]|tara:strand:- start:871 stop:1242 length:372 start_codon:yes stop_codon:yes gene_type:complete